MGGCWILKMPPEILCVIFSFLDCTKELAAWALTCKSFYALTDKETFYRIHCFNTWPILFSLGLNEFFSPHPYRPLLPSDTTTPTTTCPFTWRERCRFALQHPWRLRRAAEYPYPLSYSYYPNSNHNEEEKEEEKEREQENENESEKDREKEREKEKRRLPYGHLQKKKKRGPFFWKNSSRHEVDDSGRVHTNTISTDAFTNFANIPAEKCFLTTMSREALHEIAPQVPLD